MRFIKGLGNKSEITKLWKAVFGDSEEYINTFLNNYFKAEYCYAAVEDDIAVSMLMALPAVLHTHEKELVGKYIYAVCTHQNYRGQGISRKLTLFAEDDIKNNGGEFTCLVPAEKSLFDFYMGTGYKTYFYTAYKEYYLKDIFNTEKLQIKKVKFSELYNLRNKYFSKSSAYIKWDREFLNYLQLEAEFLKGGLISFDEGYAVCYIGDDTLLIKEICCDEEHKNQIIYTALNHYNKEKAMVFDTLGSDKQPFGMVKFLEKEIVLSPDANLPVISLVLD